MSELWDLDFATRQIALFWTIDLCRPCHVTFDKRLGELPGGLTGKWAVRWFEHRPAFERLVRRQHLVYLRAAGRGGRREDLRDTGVTEYQAVCWGLDP